MHEIIQKAFDEWTANIHPETRKIKIFEAIRDIPYYVTWSTDPEKGPVDLIIRNKGNCLPKHFLLGTMYQKLGIPIKYATYPFKWSDQDVNFPEKLKKLVDKLPVRYHIALKAYINDTWVSIDATWDLPLKKVGFPVNEKWDGVHHTLNAVTPLGEVIHETSKERIEYVESHAQYTEEQSKMIERFSVELNTWLQEVRDVHEFP